MTGQVRTHITEVAEPDCLLHAQAVRPFLNLRRAALADGIDLAPISSFRDFDRQLAIWNAKWSGARPMYDAAGGKIEAAALAPEERVQAILLWSALPGASRHHWGTDLDVLDGNASAEGYADKLTRAAFAPGAPFARLDAWLEINAARFGFFRPFKGVRSGVQAEPWHLSFAPIAEKARQTLSYEILRAALASAALQGKEVVLARLEELHGRYVAAIDLP